MVFSIYKGGGGRSPREVERLLLPSRTAPLQTMRKHKISSTSAINKTLSTINVHYPNISSSAPVETINKGGIDCSEH